MRLITTTPVSWTKFDAISCFEISLPTPPPPHHVPHYGIIYHVHHPCLLVSCINIIKQIIYIKGTHKHVFY